MIDRELLDRLRDDLLGLSLRLADPKRERAEALAEELRERLGVSAAVVAPEAIFEGGCDGVGDGYLWVPLNWRDPADPVCTYVEDPWAPTWDMGVHQIEFTYREINAMGRILLTNDPAFVP